MNKRKKTDFLTVVLFFGIILTFMIYIGLGFMFADLKGKERNAFSFNSAFYNDEGLNNIIKNYEYKAFGHVKNSNVIVGKEEFLFEICDEKYNYDYLLDYIGGLEYSDEELKTIEAEILSRQETYEKQGIEYMLVVIPNSINICSEYLPDFIGNGGGQTRLSRLDSYLSERGIDCFFNLTDDMKADIPLGQLFNNTENSVSAIGAYSIYNSVLENLPGKYSFEGNTKRLTYEDMSYIVRYTNGKEIAREAGIEDVVLNRTVSLTDDMIRRYYTEKNTGSYEKVKALEKYAQEVNSGYTVLLEFSDEWDKIQLMPYFSGTFDSVVYKTGLEYSAQVVSDNSPGIAIQFIHENELDMLLG